MTFSTTPAGRARGARAPRGRPGRADDQLRLPFDVHTVAAAPTAAPPAPERPVVPAPSSADVSQQAPLRVTPPSGGAGVAARPAVQFVRHPRARRYVLRVQPDGTLRVTIPRGGSRREAEAFATRSQAWVERQRQRLARSPGKGAALRPGDAVLVGGVSTRVHLETTDGGTRLVVGPADLVVTDTTDLRPAVAHALRRFAERELPPRLLALAADHGLRVSRVVVRDQKGRWGSCAASGTISLNWRLVQMPPEVRDYVLVHELMHLREPNHSPRFWQHVHRACPWHANARRWLVREGRALL